MKLIYLFYVKVYYIFIDWLVLSNEHSNFLLNELENSAGTAVAYMHACVHILECFLEANCVDLANICTQAIFSVLRVAKYSTVLKENSQFGTN